MVTASGREGNNGISGPPTTTLPVKEVDVGCGELSVDDVWVSGFAKLMTESALRLVDVNQDGILDVLLGFATGRFVSFY